MEWIDGHLDLAYLAVCGRDVRQEVQDAEQGCVSLPAMRRAGIRLFFGTIFTEPSNSPSQPHMYRPDDPDDAHRAGAAQLEIYHRLEAEGELSIVRSRSDLESHSARPKVILLMEGADPIRSPEEVQWWFERGLRIVGLTWATGTRYAGGNSSPAGSGPLTEQGREMISALDEAGIVHDVSHLSDAAFDGLMKHATGPVIASHSNCRALVENKQRHLRDDQIKAIISRGQVGVIGLNLYSPFLAPPADEAGGERRRACIADCVAHLQHVSQIAGHRRCVALGSDADGGFGPQQLPRDLDDLTKLSALAEALHDAGWGDDDIRGFAHENWRRLLQNALPTE